MAKPILLVSWGVPPLPSGSAVIIGNLGKQFAADEMIIAGERPYKKPPVVWRKDWAQIIYIACEWPPNWRGGRWWRWLQIPFMFVRCIWLVNKYGCSRIVAVFPNEEFLFVGYLTATWTGLPLYSYFHNTYVENRRGFGLRIARWLQARVFSRSQHLFVMSKGMVELYRKHYPDLKCSALVHSFNEDIPEAQSLPKLHRPLRLIICGNINESCREATVRFCDAIAHMDDVSLTFLSGTPRNELQELGVLRDGMRYETVSRDEVLSRLRDADIVVLPHGFTGRSAPHEYRTMFPTKTIEYLICGRPILAHTPMDSYLTHFLKEQGCALVIDQPSTSALVDGLERLRGDPHLRANLVQSALKAAQSFRAPVVAKTFRGELERRQ